MSWREFGSVSLSEEEVRRVLAKTGGIRYLGVREDRRRYGKVSPFSPNSSSEKDIEKRGEGLGVSGIARWESEGRSG